MRAIATPPANPVHGGYLADPFVLAHDGAYYAYGTGPVRDGRVFEVLHSEDLVRWASLGGGLEPLGDPGELAYWAPEVAFADGAFYLYYSVGRGDRGHVLRVATASEPQGPFRDLGAHLTPHEPFAIDPHPFRDDDGQWYLFYAKDFLTGERVGTALAVDRLLGMTGLAGEERTVLRAGADWQLYARRREMYGRVLDWHTLEGPFVVKRSGRYYLLYSGGNWQDESYGISYAVADHPLGPWLEPQAVPPGPLVLRSRGEELIGPGHCSVVVGPDGYDYLAFHAWNPARTARQMWLERLVWTEAGPRLARFEAGEGRA